MLEVLEGHPFDRGLLPKVVDSDGGSMFGSGGRFWMPGYFRRYIRNVDHFEAARAYIVMNPVKAWICEAPEEWPWSSSFRP